MAHHRLFAMNWGGRDRGSVLSEGPPTKSGPSASLRLSEGCKGRERPLMAPDGTGLAKALLGLDGFRVLGVAELGGEVVVLIEPTAERVG